MSKLLAKLQIRDMSFCVQNCLIKASDRIYLAKEMYCSFTPN